MIKLKLDEAQLRRALNNIDKYSKEVQDGVAKQIAKSTLTIESNAKRNAPVDTGRLRSSIASEITRTRGGVGVGVKYATFIEFGTYKMAAKPFLFPAWNMERPKFIESLRIILKK
jgi:HK97 gp10 family phage protein